MNRPQEMSRVRRQADLVLMAVLVASSCAAIAIGMKFDTLGTLTTALVAGVAALGAAAFVLARGSTASMFTLALANAAMVALHIQLGRGTVEFHFGVFVLLGLLLVHRDWRTIVAGAAFFAVHHILFDRLQAAGFGTYCIPKADFLTVVLHATYVVVQTGIELALAMQLRQAALEAAETTALVAAVDQGGELHLDIRGMQADTRLGASLKSVLGSMGQSVARVSQASQSIEASITGIASGNQDLNQRTEQQASALQQTSATMEQLGATVRTNAQHAEQASSLAQEAATVAGRGGDVVGQVVSTMQGISQSSQKIGDITGVIDGIAFQTNILALNAAVEAARAGEVGRGFAVVATEVRALAQRSADAAREIKSLISRNVEQVNQGNALVGEAGKTMADLVAAVQRVRGIVSEIAAASAEQRQGIDQVVDAVGQLDSATQQNAALVEQGACATENLKSQVLQLVAAVSAFKVGDGMAAQPA